MNYLTPKTRREILDLLVTGLKRLEYRGYDSAGVAIDSNDGHNIVLIKRSGKVLILEEAIKQGKCNYFRIRVIQDHYQTEANRYFCCFVPKLVKKVKQRLTLNYTHMLVLHTLDGLRTVYQVK